MPTLLLGTNVASFLATGVVTSYIELRLHDPVRSELVTTALMTPVLFVVGEMIPKEIFRSRADVLMYQVSSTLRLFTWALYPAAQTLRAITWMISRFLGGEGATHTLEVTPARLSFAFSQGTEAGVLTPYQDEIARNIIRLRKVRVSDVYLPLKEVTTAANALGRQGFLELARECRHSRIPIWQGRRTKIVGAVHVFDVLAEDRPGLTIRNYIRETPEIPPDASIYQALLTLQSSHTPLGIVEKNGEALGIVTVSDLLEEIVGDLDD